MSQRKKSSNSESGAKSDQLTDAVVADGDRKTIKDSAGNGAGEVEGRGEGAAAREDEAGERAEAGVDVGRARLPATVAPPGIAGSLGEVVFHPGRVEVPTRILHKALPSFIFAVTDTGSKRM